LGTGTGARQQKSLSDHKTKPRLENCKEQLRRKAIQHPVSPSVDHEESYLIRFALNATRLQRES
jgi:hypothetical protein